MMKTKIIMILNWEEQFNVKHLNLERKLIGKRNSQSQGFLENNLYEKIGVKIYSSLS